MKTVYIAHPAQAEIREVYARRLEPHAEIVYADDLDGDRTNQALASADAIVTFAFRREFTDETVDMVRSDAMLQSLTAGVENIPLDRLARSITIAHNGGSQNVPVAEHAMALLLSAAKRIIRGNALVGEQRKDRSLQLRRLRGKTCTILGFGGIGSEIGRLLTCFGVEIIAINTTGRTDQPVHLAATLADLDRVLEQTNFLIITVPATPKTIGRIGPTQLSKLPSDAILINVSRAQIVDQEALYRHLHSHPEFLAAFDIWWNESQTDDDLTQDFPFHDLANFMGTPHVAARVPGILEDMAEAAAVNVERHLTGGKVINRVERD